MGLFIQKLPGLSFFVLLMILLSTRRPPTQCQTPAHPHPRVEPRTINRWSSSFLLSISTLPSLCRPSSTNCTHRRLDGPLPHPFSSNMPTIHQYSSTNPRFPSFNLPLFFPLVFFFERTRSAASMRPACLIYLSTSMDTPCMVGC